jgi:putative oxidoreductase
MTFAKIAPVVLRVLVGALFAFSGVNKLVPLISPPGDLPPAAGAYLAALAATGYTLPLLGVVEVLAGGALIAGYFVPLALVVLAPLVINIALFHTVLAPALPMVLFLVAAELYLAWAYRDAFAGVLRAQARPVAVTAAAAAKGDSHAALAS